MHELQSQTIGNYLQALASGQPTPGGGAAAALTAAQGAALLSMVCNLTIGKPKFLEFEAELSTVLNHLIQTQAAMAHLADKDVAAFDKVMTAYRLPKSNEGEIVLRSTQIQAALQESAVVAFDLFALSFPILALADRLKIIGNPSVISDVIVGRHLLFAAVLSAQANVEANLVSLDDQKLCGAMRGFMTDQLAKLSLAPDGSAAA